MVQLTLPKNSRIGEGKTRPKPDGAIWVSWPKRAA